MSQAPATGPEAEAARAERVGVLATQRDVGELLVMLSDPSWFVRRAVVFALGALGDAADLALIEGLQTHRDDEARIAASVDALVASASARLDAALIDLTRQELEPAVLADVVQILGRRRTRAAYEALGRLTRHGDDNVAVAAIEALGKLGGRAAVDALLACLGTKHFFRTFPAIDVLGRSGDPRAVAPLSELLNDSHYALEAARALGRSADRRAVAPLLGLLLSPSGGNVRVACLALVELCERHGQLYGSELAAQETIRRAASDTIVRRLGESVTRADKAERIATCKLLGLLRLESAMPILSALLDAEPDVAEAAGQAVLEIGRANENVLMEAITRGDAKRRTALLPLVAQRALAPAVLACLEDGSADVRVLACAALARIGAVAGVPALFTLLSDSNARVVNAALSAIQSLGSDQTEALALKAARVPRTQRPALRVLAYFGFPSAQSLFAEAVRDPDPRVRDIAFHGLSLMERPEARAVLLACCEAEDPTVRAAAVRALGHADDSAMTPQLLRHLRDGDPWVRYYACQALGRSKASDIEMQLLPLVGDRAGQVRVAAIEALAQLGGAKAVQALREFSDHEDLDLRRAALVGLGLAGDQSSLPVLLAAASEGDATTRLVALSALTRFSDERVVTLWLDAARTGSEPLRVAAINLLAERPGLPAASGLVRLLLEAGENNLVVSALSRDVEGRVSALESGLTCADDDQARVLVTCLARSSAEGAQRALYRGAVSPSAAVRRAVASALSGLNTQEARALLAEVAVNDPDAEVRSISHLHLETL